MAVILASGLDGIRNNLTPPDAVDQNIYKMSRNERELNGIDSLPSSLEFALIELEMDHIVREALGDHILEKFTTAKELEWNKYRTRVHNWEHEEYLRMY